MNGEIQIAKEYHEGTKHSYMSIRTDQYYLDWANKPNPYKQYKTLRPIPLPRDFDSPEEPALAAVAGYRAHGGTLDIRGLAKVLFYSAGMTKQLRFGDETFDFRAASCAGALYPIEVYVVTGGTNGLDAGIYHFHPKEFALRRLRAGDFRTYLYDASQDESMKSAQATLVFTAIFWRSAWKYRARSYRYCYWDCGTILANLLATTFASNLPTKVITGFYDEGMNRLLAIDGEYESALCLVPLGVGSEAKESPPPEELSYEVEPLSSKYADHPLIKSIHSVSMLRKDEVGQWRKDWLRSPSPAGGRLISTRQLDPAQGKSPLGRTIVKRGSTRRFTRDSISFENLSTILTMSTKGIPCDFLSEGSSLVDVYTIANAVTDLVPGGYYYSKEEKGFQLLKSGDFRKEAGYLCLEQRLPEDAAAVNFIMSDLEGVLTAYGNRGYRLAQLEAGIRGGKMYLSAYAQGIGASGLTFFDDDVTSFFSPHAEGKSCMLVIAVGIKMKNWRQSL